MNHVWLFFKALQLLTDIACFSIHIAGSLHFEEPLPHNLIFCGTFAGYILIATLRAVRLLSGQRTHLYPALFVETSGMLMYFICSLLSLYYAEIDLHLLYMGPTQELEHTFFIFCKQQSVACIMAGAIRLLEAVLLLDFIIKSPSQADEKPMQVVTEPPIWDDTYKDLTIEELDKLSRTQANVYLLGRKFDHWIRVKYNFFRQLAGAQVLLYKMESDESLTVEDSSESNSLEYGMGPSINYLDLGPRSNLLAEKKIIESISIELDTSDEAEMGEEEEDTKNIER